MASFREAFLGKRFVCCALTIVYSIYNTVGQSIASIYYLGSIFTSGSIYRLWTSLPYYIYTIYSTVGRSVYHCMCINYER